MSRQIRFRAWCIRKNKMYSNEDMWRDSYQYGDFFDDEDITLMQFTGLQDKNGVEIYEGDILLEDSHPFSVVWDAGRAGFKLKHGLVHQYPEWNRGVKMAIIGNIHENPELLEAGL